VIEKYCYYKTEQNIKGALSLCSPEYQLMAPQLSAPLLHHDAVVEGLHLFFRSFPDFLPKIDNIFQHNEFYIVKGSVRKTPTVYFLGIPFALPTLQVPFESRFLMSKGKIAQEIYWLDDEALKAQLSIPDYLFRAVCFLTTRKIETSKYPASESSVLLRKAIL
jgi:predicted ester cyclase